MTPTLHVAERRHRPHQQVPPATGPVGRIIAASVAAGLVVAVVLIAVVFPGAAEATITGSLLVAFGLGWAVMGGASTRFTPQPLTWTRVPAAAMAATGVALIVSGPQDAGMRTLGWIWPVPAAALGVYVWVHARRSVPRRGRWMLTPIAAVLGLAAVGATYENIALVRDQHADSAPGSTHDVNGHDLYLDCRGQGSPTVVLFNGMGEVTPFWARIVDQTDTHTRICAYDRAGQGWSGDVDRPQDGITAAHDLHTLLAKAGEHGPYVLAGHSIGGPYALTYAAEYPEDVAGMVLLDSSSPHQFTAMPAFRSQYAVMRRGLALMPTLDRLGFGRLLNVVQPSHLPGDARDMADSLTGTARGARSGRDDVSVLPALFAQSQALTTLHDRPLAVLTARSSFTGTAGWAEAQAQLAALSTDAVHQVVDSTHAGMLEDQAPARISAGAINEVVDAVRTGTALNRS